MTARSIWAFCLPKILLTSECAPSSRLLPSSCFIDMHRSSLLHIFKASTSFNFGLCARVSAVCCRKIFNFFFTLTTLFDRIANKFLSFDALLSQEHGYLQKLVAKIAALQPDIVVVEKAVSRLAQDFLLEVFLVLIFNLGQHPYFILFILFYCYRPVSRLS
jgi:hypothetical protein